MVFYLASQAKERKHTIGELVNNGLFFVGERERIWTICFGIVVLSTFGGIVTSRLLGLRHFVIVGVEIGLNITKCGSTII